MSAPARETLSTRETILVVLLRLGGVLMASAVVAVFLPRPWMSAIAQSIELGPLPEPPLFDYLARSASGLYAIHGALLLLISTDVRRYRVFVLFVVWSDVIFGTVVTIVDVWVGMPLWWTLSEGPWIVLVGLLMLWLSRDIRPVRG